LSNRSAISKKLRFDIFKRDNFACQYCGRHPPMVVLEIDHIVAVAGGGTSNSDNLVTSCFDCNRGKSATPLSVVPKSLHDKAMEIAEREAQLLGYHEIMAAKRDRLERQAWDIVEEFCGTRETRRDWFQSIKRFVETLGFHEVLDAMEIARSRKPRADREAFLYFCGICWNKINEATDG
jgi:HNH endonuclease